MKIKKVFDYPIEFTTLPDYSARRGQVVTVLRSLTPKTNIKVDEPPDTSRMYEIETDDGWRGEAFEEELLPFQSLYQKMIFAGE